DRPSQSYLTSKERPPQKIPIISQILHLTQHTSQQHLLSQLQPLNNHHSLTPILLQLPLPNQLTQQKLLQPINPQKHLHAFHPT
ncbi:tetrahydrofolate dehydrogenase/cyclohydrolase catalytic domain-containing protein, partial [Staphylococcus warneri]|uniref:tetrahydrofolate dehydrogenase/cyclohydrolase catalytic domain-containing protein n=1 Tax=Staphylococcus warneri TaxID=1292 RepID=UPI0037042381